MQPQEQEDKGMLSKPVAFGLLLLFYWVDQVRAASCGNKCAGIDVLPPFSIGDGCGNPAFRLDCTRADEEQLVLYYSPDISVNGIDYGSKTISFNTTQWFRSLPAYMGSCIPVDAKSFDFLNDQVVLCKPRGEPAPSMDDFRTPDGCVLRKRMTDSRNGLECTVYSKEKPTSVSADIGAAVAYDQFITYETVSWAGFPQDWAAPAPSAKPRKKSALQVEAIGGGIAAGVVGVAAVVAACFWCFRRRKRRLGQDSSSKALFLFSNGKKQDSYAYNKGYSFSSGDSTRFTLQQLEEATNNFSEEGRLGDGGFGTVYKGRLADGRLVAVKKLNPWNAQGKHQFDNEVTILSQVKHGYLVQLYGCCLEGRELLLVYELVANGTLADHLHGLDTSSRSYLGPVVACFLDWESRLKVAAQTAEALAFLHTEVDPPIFHRDVKSTNILVDENWNAKVGDFGLSRLVPSLELTHVTTAPQGTPGYLDPDYHQSYQLTDKSDVYSLGVVIMEIVSAMPAVDMSRGRKEINLATMAVARIQEGRLDSIMDRRLGEADDEVLWGQVRRVAELGFRCLALEKEDRPTMREVAETLKEVLDEASQRSFKKKIPAAVDSPTSVQVKWPSTTASPVSSLDSIV